MFVPKPCESRDGHLTMLPGTCFLSANTAGTRHVWVLLFFSSPADMSPALASPPRALRQSRSRGAG